MQNFEIFGLITDDPIWSAIISSYIIDDKKYFPIITMPRMNRNDWEEEVFKRVVGINRTKIEILFCKSEDYGLLAPLRSKIKIRLIPLRKPENISDYINIKIPAEEIIISETDYLYGLLEAKRTKKKIRINNNKPEKLLKGRKTDSDTVTIIEIINEVTDITAINYANHKNYDIIFIEKINTEKTNSIELQLKEISVNSKLFKDYKDKISIEIANIIDWEPISKCYDNIQIFVSKLPIGLFIENKSIAHIQHLQSDLRIIDNYYYTEKQNLEKDLVLPSVLFVDIQSDDLISEIPAINNELEDYKHWSFHLDGEYANSQNFKFFCSHFPFDLLFVSGHGSSPRCREVKYKFKSSDGNDHTAKILEYYQIGKKNKKGEYFTEAKQYFKEFDDISWTDKETLDKHGISHILPEFISAQTKHLLEHVESKEINPVSIEGLLLNDGVFLGNISNFSEWNNPIVFFNTCGSLLELGVNISFAGARAMIGTLWSITDSCAGLFAKEFFKNLSNKTLVEAFTAARNLIEDDLSKYSYIYWGMLNSCFILTNEVTDEDHAKQIMAEKLLISLIESINNYQRGHLDKKDLGHLFNISQNFSKKNNIDVNGEKLKRISRYLQYI